MNNKYGIIEQEKSQFPVRKLLVVPHIESDLTVSFPSFGPNNYERNLKEMQKTYSHPLTGKQIRFRPATTSESISAVAYDFKNIAKPKIFDPRWLQAGYIVRTQDGVFTNTQLTDESQLKQMLDSFEKVNGIYLGKQGFAFAPYESFERGIQEADTFVQGGLARALEHTPEKIAPKLKEIASPEFYNLGVDVWGFGDVKEPILRIASLNSYRNLDGGGLNVGGDWDDDYGGFAFGVLDKSRSDVLEK